MESIIKIRRSILRDGESIRSVSRRTGLSRHTIRKYLGEGSEPHYRRSHAPVLHKLADYEERLRLYYEQDLKRPRRERRTVLKLYEQLIEEGYTGSCAPVYRSVKDLKSDQLSSGKAFIPLAFQIGDALQFDWSEEHVVLGGMKEVLKPPSVLANGFIC